MQTSLDDLALKYGTDKGSMYHGYCRQYDTILAGLRARGIRVVLEIGVRRHDWGHNRHPFPSLAMWRDWAPQAAVIGADRRAFKDSDGFSIFRADQSREEDMRALARHIVTTVGLCDIIVDDGSHRASDQQISLGILWPILASGGAYIIEDLNYRPCGTRRRSCTKGLLEAKLIGKHPEWIEGINLTDVFRQIERVEFADSAKAGARNSAILFKKDA